MILEDHNICPIKPLYGNLRVIGTQLCGEAGQPVQLVGVSSHELQKFGQFFSPEAIHELVRDWGLNVIRLSVVDHPDEDGFALNRSIMGPVIQAIDAAIADGIYIIADWHVLYNGNPHAYIEDAKLFFGELADAYPDTPNIIFELCNEPNGENITWDQEIKRYVAEMLALIRGKGLTNIVLAGTGTWSQDIHHAAADPVEDSNTMYVCHFYAYSHREFLRKRVKGCLNGQFGQKIPVFVSEWGTTDSAGDLNFDERETTRWLDFMDDNMISWCNWSFADKKEGSAILKPGAKPYGPWLEQDLTPSGLLVKNRIKLRGQKQ